METKKLDLGRTRANQETMRKGRWMTFERGGRFLIAFLGIAAFGRRRDLLRTEWLFNHGKKKSAVDEIPENVDDELTARALFGSVVLGWSDVQGPDGGEFAFTEDHLVFLLCGEPGTDEERFWGVPGLTNAIMEFSKRAENFERASREDTKSAPPQPARVGEEVGVASGE